MQTRYLNTDKATFTPILLSLALLASGLWVCMLSRPAVAEVGEAYLNIPGVDGAWIGESYHNWIKVEGRYWGENAAAPGRGTGAAIAHPVYSLPTTPYEGSGELVFSVRKDSPALSALNELCKKQAEFPHLTLAESADDFRNPALELGGRPHTIPEFFEHKLSGVRMKSCPVAEGAPEQAFILEYTDIDWLNYDHNKAESTALPYFTRTGLKGELLPLEPASFPIARSNGKVKTFVVNWFGYAHDVNRDQCPVMNSKPELEDFKVLPADFATDGADPQQEARRISLRLERRGPGFTNVDLLPGVAPDPGNAAPRSVVARGINLDNDNGIGSPPAGICPHKNYQSDDGRTGIDNQFYTVAGCIPGLQGYQGLWMQVLNEEWRSGAISLLIQISGIEDELNDDSIELTLLYSEDDAVKDVSGKEILPDYTFRISGKPEHNHFFTRIPARIVDGVILTDTSDSLTMNMVKGPKIQLANARMRLQFTPEGNLKGELAGYQYWRYLVNYYNFGGFEVTFGFQAPAFYNALRNAADGLKDPVTGECDGISTVFDIEAFPAFLPDSEQQALSAMVANPRSEGQ